MPANGRWDLIRRLKVNSENVRVIPVKKCKHRRNDNNKMN